MCAKKGNRDLKHLAVRHQTAHERVCVLLCTHRSDGELDLAAFERLIRHQASAYSARLVCCVMQQSSIDDGCRTMCVLFLESVVLVSVVVLT